MLQSEITLYTILRLHGTGELANQPVERLRVYQEIITARIGLLTWQLATTNMFKNVAADLRSDVRWFGLVQEEIGQLLTAEVHQK